MTQETKSAFAALLRYWRHRRGFSQLDLAHASDVSARHLSFLETGRSKPSERMALLLGATLDLPLRQRDALLRAAGFAPFYEPRPETIQGPVSRMLDQMADQHEPFPMVVMNRRYDILRTNQGAHRLFSFAGLSHQEPDNSMLLLFDPTQMRPYIQDWKRLGAELVSRLHRESLHAPHDESLSSLLDTILAFDGVEEQWRQPDFARGTNPILEVALSLPDTTLRFAATITTFSAPQNIDVEELQIESYFPTDDLTASWCRDQAH